MIKKIAALLPATDCQMCGMTCADFAGFLLSGELSVEDCPGFQDPALADKLSQLQELLSTIATRAKSGHLIDTAKCIGCGICVVVCEYNLANNAACRQGKGPAIEDQVPIRVIDGVATLADETLCTRLQAAADKCSKCQDNCPAEAIALI